MLLSWQSTSLSGFQIAGGRAAIACEGVRRLTGSPGPARLRGESLLTSCNVPERSLPGLRSRFAASKRQTAFPLPAACMASGGGMQCVCVCVCRGVPRRLPTKEGAVGGRAAEPGHYSGVWGGARAAAVSRGFLLRACSVSAVKSLVGFTPCIKHLGFTFSFNTSSSI